MSYDRKLPAAGLSLACLSLFALLTGCASGSGGGRSGGGASGNVTAAPQFQPSPQLKAAGGARLPVAVAVKDARQARGQVQGDGREEIAAGDKGRVYLPRTVKQTFEDSLAAGLQAAGFTVSADAPVVVEATVTDLPVQAWQFTHSNLPSERASTLDAIGAILPGPVRETTAKTSLTVVVRRKDSRLGFSHTAGGAAANTSGDLAVVGQTVGQVVSAAVNQAVAEAAPDVEIVTRAPATVGEIDDRSDEITRQRKLIEDLTATLTAREKALSEDRAALDVMRQKVEDERRQAQAVVAADRQGAAADRQAAAADRQAAEQALAKLGQDRASLDQERAKVDQDRQRLDADRAALGKTLSDLAAQQAQVEKDKAQVQQERAKVGQDRARVDTDRRALIAKAEELSRKPDDQPGVKEDRAKLEQDRKALEQKAADVEKKAADLDRKSADADKQAGDLGRQSADLSRRNGDLDAQAKALATQSADAARRKQELDARAAALARQATDVTAAAGDVEARKKDLEEREKNLAAYAAKLDAQTESNQSLSAELRARQTELRDRDAALQSWKKDLEARASARPPAAIVQARRPLVVITDPAAASRETTLPRMTVSGIASDDRKLAAVRAIINGGRVIDLKTPDGSKAVLVRTLTPRPPGGDTARGPGTLPTQPPAANPTAPDGAAPLAAERFAFDVDLQDGDNNIEVEAIDDEGLRTVEKVTVKYRRGEGRTVVVTIGINDYLNRTTVPPLKFAAGDAKGVANAFRGLVTGTAGTSAGSVGPRVREMLDAQASRSALFDYLFYQLPAEVKPEDTVVIFFSGHGAPDTVTDAKGNVETFLLPIDADPTKLFSTAIRMSDVGTMLRRLRSERIVFLADTCYSGAATEGGRTVPIAGGGVALRAVGVRTLPKRPEGKGCAVITASTGTQVAQERDEYKHGIFSYYVLQGLSGAADRDGDKSVTVDELYDYVKEQVGKATNGSQTPQISRDPSAGGIVLAKVAK